MRSANNAVELINSEGKALRSPLMNDLYSLALFDSWENADRIGAIARAIRTLNHVYREAKLFYIFFDYGG